MAKAKANARGRKNGGISVSLSLNALIGIMLAIIGVFMVFNRISFENSQEYLIKVVAVFLICIGTISVVHYARHNDDAAALVVGILEIVVGVALIIAPIANFLMVVIGASLILYGVIQLVKFHKHTLDVISYILFIVVGALIITTFFFPHEIFILIVGIAALVGAVYFMFFA